MKLTELRQKISLTKLDGQRSSLNGKQMKEKVFMSKLLQMILNGISLVNYINGSLFGLVFLFQLIAEFINPSQDEDKKAAAYHGAQVM